MRLIEKRDIFRRRSDNNKFYIREILDYDEESGADETKSETDESETDENTKQMNPKQMSLMWMKIKYLILILNLTQNQRLK